MLETLTAVNNHKEDKASSPDCLTASGMLSDIEPNNDVARGLYGLPTLHATKKVN